MSTTQRNLPIPASNGSAPTAQDFAEAERAIARLGSESDTTTLRDVASQADMVALYQRRRADENSARQFMRLARLAEAEIGKIDFTSAPGPVLGEPLRIGDDEILSAMRSRWRLLGIADIRGLLRPALAGEDVSTMRLVYELGRVGVRHVDAKVVRAALDAADLTMAEASRRAGLVPKYVQGWSCQGRFPYFLAAPLAEVAGVDPTKFPPFPVKRKRQARSARLPKKYARGRYDELYSLIRRALQEVDALGHTQNGRKDERLWSLLNEAVQIAARRT